jgi:hypothetical protein
MRGPSWRRGLSLALAGAALLSSPGWTRGARPDDRIAVTPEWASVGRVVSRRVDGRTIVLIPVAGPVRPRLSEPFRVGARWRLYLTLEGAQLGINARPRIGAGVLNLTVTEAGSDVRIAVDVSSLTSYGTKPSEEGLLLWIEDEATAEHRAREQARALPVIGEGPRLAAAEPPPEPEPESPGWLRLVLLLVVAAGLGLAFRWWRKRGTMPHWVAAAGVMLGGAFLAELRHKVFGSSTETDGTGEEDVPVPETEPEATQLRKTG